MKKLPNADSTTAELYQFSDNGLFGIQLEGSADEANTILKAAVPLLKKPISAEELQIAQTQLETELGEELASSYARIEEVAKTVRLLIYIPVPILRTSWCQHR